MNEQIKELMLEAINLSRPEIIQPYMLPVWNQPFFYKIDKAKVLTISYNPTDKGARTNYPHIVEEYKRMGYIDAERLFNLLYDFKKEKYWRRRYDIIFCELGIDADQISHMDVSFYPYKSLELCLEYSYIDNSKQYMLKCIEILEDQLKYIFVDGKKNKPIISLLSKDFRLIKKTFLPVNSKNQKYELLIYKHNEIDMYLIYYGCQLYGATSPSDECVINIARCIKKVVEEQ